MSQCQNCQFNKIASPQRRQIENYTNKFSPTNYDEAKNTYTIGDGYYAPPWPARRTEYDIKLQNKFSTAGIPDFLNYKGVSTSGEMNTITMSTAKPTKKSILTGRYDVYSSYSY